MRKGLLALLVLALALSAAGCGSRDVLALDPVASAAAKTDAAGSSRVALEVAGNILGRDVTVRGQGAYDYANSRGRFDLDSSLLAGARVEVRAVDSTLYVRLPAGLSFWFPSVKPWLAVRGGQSLQAVGLGDLEHDPGQLLALVRASSTAVAKTGTASVRGVETTRYSAQLELTKALEANAGALGLTEQERVQLRLLVEELRRQSRLQTVPVTVFVDDEGLVRRLTLAGDGDRISVDFWDFGADVDVQAPPVKDVQKLFD